MKLKFKLILTAIEITALAAVVNHYFKLIMKTKRSCCSNHPYESSYSYRFGTVRYTKKGSGAPMLLLHSPNIGGSKSEWDTIIDTLSKNHTVYAPDLPGFGHSAQPEMPYSSYLYASFINDFVENVIGIPTVALASGKSADFLLCASSFKEGNFRKLVLISPTGFKNMPQKCPCRLVAKRVMELPLYGTFLYNMAWLDFMTFSFIRRYLLRINPKHSPGFSDQTSKFALSALLSGNLNLDVRSMATKIGVPILIALGSTDNIGGIPAEIEALMFCELNGMPHLAYDNDKFISETLAWLKK